MTGTASTPSAYQGSLPASKPVQNARSRGQAEPKSPKPMVLTYTVEGQPYPRSEQGDGPALQTLAILRAFPQLDAPTQATAASVINTNINYLLGTDPQSAGVPVYQGKTWNLWEEEFGFSFFARSVQLKCFQQLTANTYGIPVPPATAGAITFLRNALAGHWNDQDQYYQSILPVPTDRGAYDPNIDIVLSSIYGAVPVTDTKLLATAAQIRQQWSGGSIAYPINENDQGRTPPIGPLLGRYPGDTYDGDTQDPAVVGHRGHCAPPISPCSTTRSRIPSHSLRRCPWITCPRISSARSGYLPARRRAWPLPSCKVPQTRCSMPWSSTAIISS